MNSLSFAEPAQPLILCSVPVRLPHSPIGPPDSLNCPFSRCGCPAHPLCPWSMGSSDSTSHYLASIFRKKKWRQWRVGDLGKETDIHRTTNHHGISSNSPSLPYSLRPPVTIFSGYALPCHACFHRAYSLFPAKCISSADPHQVHSCKPSPSPVGLTMHLLPVDCSRAPPIAPLGSFLKTLLTCRGALGPRPRRRKWVSSGG